jgi:hypothetical protein
MRVERRVVSLLTVGLAAGLALPAPAADPVPLSVFITEAKVEPRPEVDDATKNALKKKREEAKNARKALEKDLKAQFGKKRETWPDEKDQELYVLEEAEALAEVDYEYRKIDPKAIGDAVEDVARAVEGKGLQAAKKDHVKLATSPADADVVVEVVARRAQKSLGAVMPSDCWLLFTIGAGERTSTQFGKIPATYRVRKFMLPAWKVAGPSATKPNFTFESWNGGGSPVGCHGAAANAASGLIDKFVEDNQPTLTQK